MVSTRKERTLVVLELNGGNDALNTIVPFNNGLYYDYRPGIGIAQQDVLPINGEVIALHEGNCTACMLCARECPDWCIYIEGHKEKAPPRRAGGKPRQVNILDRFDIDYALCMFCGICVDVCPFEALFWSPEYEFSEPRIADLLHDKERLTEWMETVPEFEDYEPGSVAKKLKVPPT